MSENVDQNINTDGYSDQPYPDDYVNQMCNTDETIRFNNLNSILDYMYYINLME